MSYSIIIRHKAISLRKRGHSVKEIANILKISKATSSAWCSDVKIGKKAQVILATKKKHALVRANHTLDQKRETVDARYTISALNELSTIHFTKPLCKLLCAIFIWTEGGKSDKYRVSFTNSDPTMIKTFLTLFRAGFKINERKLRGLIHVHAYHNEQQMKLFWSNTTKIPLPQFTKSYHKANTKKRIHPGYKGSMHVTYYDSQVAHELRKLYNTFALKMAKEI